MNGSVFGYNKTTSHHIIQKHNLSTAFDSPPFTSINEEVNDANDRYKGRVSIQSTTDLGWGVYASKTFYKGDIVFTMKALETFNERSSHTVQIDWNKHATIDLPGRFINHSCDANCGIMDNASSGAYDAIALKTIQKGQDLSIDYETFEYEISAFEACMCGVSTCRRMLGGFKKHGNEIKDTYGSYIANYLKRSAKSY